MRNIKKDIEKMEKLADKSDKYDMTASEMYYLKDTYPEFVKLLHATYLFGYAQGMKGGE